MFQRFASFDKMLTPTIIQVIFWVGVVFFVLLGLISMFDGGIAVITGILTILLGPLFVRVYCEMLIIFFKIHDAMNSLNDKVDKLNTNLTNNNSNM